MIVFLFFILCLKDSEGFLWEFISNEAILFLLILLSLHQTMGACTSAPEGKPKKNQPSPAGTIDGKSTL